MKITNDFECCQHIFRPARRYTPFVAKTRVCAHILVCHFMMAASGYCLISKNQLAHTEHPTAQRNGKFFDNGLTVRLTVEDSPFV